MIDKKIYDLDYIRELQARYKTDPGLLERVLYAFGLLLLQYKRDTIMRRPRPDGDF